MSLLEVRRGDAYADDRRLTVTVVTEDGDPYDLTGLEPVFEVRRTAWDDEATIRKTVGSGVTLATQSGDTLGLAYIELDPEDTADMDTRPFWVWELAVDGPITLDTGRFVLLRDLIVEGS